MLDKILETKVITNIKARLQDIANGKNSLIYISAPDIRRTDEYGDRHPSVISEREVMYNKKKIATVVYFVCNENWLKYLQLKAAMRDIKLSESARVKIVTQDGGTLTRFVSVYVADGSKLTPELILDKTNVKFKEVVVEFSYPNDEKLLNENIRRYEQAMNIEKTVENINEEKVDIPM